MDGISEQFLDALAAAGHRAAEERDLGLALEALGQAVSDATGSEAVVIRIVDEAGMLVAHTVVARSEALGAELAGSSFALDELSDGELAGEKLPAAIRRGARRAGAADVLLVPARAGGKPLGSLELLRARRSFKTGEAVAARFAASQLGLMLHAFLATNGSQRDGAQLPRALALAGDALAASLDRARAADEIARIAARAAGAEAALLWQPGEEGTVELLASSGPVEASPAAARTQAERAIAEHEPVRVEPEDALGRSVASLTLGQPPVGVLQLVFPAGMAPGQADLDRLATFAVRAAQALRANERARTTSLGLERAEALLAVVGQAIAELSLSHTLETAVARVSELLRSERVAVYLREGPRLHAEAGRGVGAAELAVAERLLVLAFGPLRAQGMLYVPDAQADLRLASVRDAVHEAEIDAVAALPLVARGELIGLLAAYLPRGRHVDGNESSLLIALASQLSVAVQNAQLHERTERLAAEREEALAAERHSAKRLRALYEISRSFTQSLSLDETLQAVARAAAELLEADAAVIRMQDERGDLLVPRGNHIVEPRLADALRPLVTQDQAVEKLPGRRLFRMGKPLVLDAGSARRLGASYELLVPFLEQGASAIVVPIATPVELLATLTVISLDSERRIGDEALETALFVAGQAALAIDNARLYQQQKDFADTMQHSLLPRGLPELDGLDVGAIYESSARMDVGGDVYDFLALPDGRLAVVLGDVSGHGVTAAADMALAKFAFRALVRQYPDPGELLAQVNEVALGELSGSSFVTMACLTVDPGSGEVQVASAGHPPARLLAPDGSVTALAPRGLALGVEGDQRYEELRTTLPPGAALCLYTDGLVEVRRDGDQYGDERLDAALSTGRELAAQALAEHVVADCRAFGGEPEDDYAVVVIHRSG
jgi:serine phosphatase RsbU (regulator of sigma subunit)/PAS domain-containing protein